LGFCTIGVTRNKHLNIKTPFIFLKIFLFENTKNMKRIVENEIVIVGGGICGLATALALHRFFAINLNFYILNYDII
jgi:ribulose 1,5-bisphosphate synthetase/thiazole synthase